MKNKSTLRASIAAALLASFAASSAFADARVRIAHFAPFSDVRDASSVTFAADDEAIGEALTFGEFSDYVDLPAGTYEITVTPVDATEPSITAEATVADDVDYTLAAIGNGTDQPLDLLVLVDDNEPSAPDDLKLRVVHAAPFADTPEATAVSIRTDDGEVFGGLDNVSYGVASSVLVIPAGTYDLKVSTPDGGTNLIDAAPVDLPAGESITLFAVGDSVNEPLALIALPVGELTSNVPVDDRYSGNWFNPETPGQGIGFHPIAGQDRIFATWYTFADGGVATWYALDTCATPGSVECNTTGFDGERAVFSIVASTGGVFDEASEIDSEAVGELIVDFIDCNRAAATYTLDGQEGSFDLVNLTPLASCVD